WLAAIALLAVYGLALPLRRRPENAELAAAIEHHFPGLSERLTTAVEAAGPDGSVHGSPAFMALLIEETAAASARLRFADAIPLKTAGRLGATAAVVFVMFFWSGLYWPDWFAVRSQRFL